MTQSNRTYHAHLSVSDWEKIISGWESSNLSQSVYCQKNNVTIGSFSYWRTKLQRTKKTKPDNGDDVKPKFSSVNVIPSEPTPILEHENTQKHIKILFPDKISLNLPVEFRKTIITFISEALEGKQ